MMSQYQISCAVADILSRALNERCQYIAQKELISYLTTQFALAFNNMGISDFHPSSFIEKATYGNLQTSRVAGMPYGSSQQLAEYHRREIEFTTYNGDPINPMARTVNQATARRFIQMYGAWPDQIEEQTEALPPRPIQPPRQR